MLGRLQEAQDARLVPSRHARQQADRGDRLTISIVSINYHPEVAGIGVYSTGLAEYLARKRHRVRVHTGFAYYPQWRKEGRDRRALFRRERAGGVDLRRSYLYVPYRPSVPRRILHELSFTLSASVAYMMAERSDVTMVVSPPLLLGAPIALLARLKGSRTIMHVQDLQPDAALELEMLGTGWIMRLLYCVESLTYRLMDHVSAISLGMLDRIRAKGVQEHKLLLLRNWANDDLVRPASRDTGYRAQWALGGRFVVLYSGNLGVKQGLRSVVQAAHLLRGNRDIVFVIVGDGGEKNKLLQEAAKLDLDNVQFRPLQPVGQLSELLATADLALVPQKRGVSDIVLPSKVMNLMCSGRPMVAAAMPGTELHRILNEAQCAVLVPPEDPGALAEAIARLYDAPKECRRLGANGRICVERDLGHRSVLDAFEGWLKGVT